LFGLEAPPLELDVAPPSLVPDELPPIEPLDPIPAPELLELDVSPDPDDELLPELGAVPDPDPDPEEEPPELPPPEPIPGVVTG
jgi:hypothetical protein